MLTSDIKILTAEQIAQVIDRAEQIVEVPEWGGAVKIKAWSLEERDIVVSKITDTGRADGKVDPQKFIRALVVYGVTEPKLTEELLATKAYAAIDRIANAILILNGMKKEAALSAHATFRPESGSPVAIQDGQGIGHDGSALTQ